MHKIEITVNVNIGLKKTDMNEILRAHYFAENTTHIVKIKNSENLQKDVKDYLGTTFIYKQMVFNMIYDKFGNSTAKEKIRNLINWVYANNSSTDNIMFTITDKDLEKIKNIITDKTITQNKKEKFISIMEKRKNEESLSIDEISEIFIFINNVRNNFFHGTKKAQEAIEKGQNERFEIYSKFLSKLSLDFFSRIKNEDINLSYHSLKDDLKENLGLLKR
ncbi:MAG: hypothetical protein ACRC0R_03820 [Cetobacterium sp.]